jgi:chromosome segregation ATPase
MWPVDDELRRRRERSDPATADHSNGRQAPATAAVVRHNGHQHDQPPPADAAESVRRAEADLAGAASAHWQREHDLAEAEAAMQDVKDRLETLDQQRMQLRREKVTAEQDLAAARAAQRAALRTVDDARRALEAAEKRLQPPTEHPRTHNGPE